MLDGHVNVFELDALGYTVALVFLGNAIQTIEDRSRVVLADDLLIAEHRRMRLRGRDVLPPQSLVERDRRIDPRHQLGRVAPEPSAPGALRWRFVSHRCRTPG